VGLAIIFNQVTISLPPIVLGVFKTNYEVGIFSAAYKIVFMLLVIERVFYYVFFPVLAKQHKQNPEKLKSSFSFLMRFLFASTIPVALGGLMLAPGIIELVYGHAFMDAVNVLRILLLYFVIVPVDTIFGYGLVAIDQERRFFKVITITAIINAVLILLLSVQFGFFGAACALLVSEIISIVLMYRQLKKYVQFACLRFIPKPVVAGLLMAISLYVLPQWHVILLILVAACVYLLIFYLLRGISKQDLRNFRNVILEK
jgi:O-antigen/teichoic acid export membrane protein